MGLVGQAWVVTFLEGVLPRCQPTHDGLAPSAVRRLLADEIARRCGVAAVDSGPIAEAVDASVIFEPHRWVVRVNLRGLSKWLGAPDA